MLGSSLFLCCADVHTYWVGSWDLLLNISVSCCHCIFHFPRFWSSRWSEPFNRFSSLPEISRKIFLVVALIYIIATKSFMAAMGIYDIRNTFNRFMEQWLSMIWETQSTDSSGVVFVLPRCVSSSLFQLKLSTLLQLDALDVELLVDVISIEAKQIIPEVVSFVQGPFFSNQQRWRFHYCSRFRTDEGCNW